MPSIVLVPLLLACGADPVTHTVAPAPGVPAGPPPAAPVVPDLGGAESVIRALYAPYLESDSPAIPPGIHTPGLVTPTLDALLRAERRAAEAASMPGVLGFDVVVDAQDWRISDLGLVTTGTATSAVVVATFSNFGQPTEVRYTLVHDGEAWRVDDVRFPDGRSLRALLKP